jgi:lipopolysaccharide biosynthesis glycosyltransferase
MLKHCLAYWEPSQDWSTSIPEVPFTPPPLPTPPQVDSTHDSSAESAKGILFDHSPAESIVATTATDDLKIISSSIKLPVPLSTNTAAPEPTQKKKKHAIVTAIWDYSYSSMALMLGHSIKQHNDLEALDAELVLFTLQPDDEWLTGLTSWNKTVLQEKGGWKIRAEPHLEVPGVNLTQIQPHRRLNLNKLKIFGWAEYERVVFIDADCIVKGSIEELFKLPKEVEFAAAPDGWPQIEVDSRFNSGFMFFTPSQGLFENMISKLADKKYHDPKEGDQQFLQNYWKFRDYKLPIKFNLNLVHFVWHKKDLWDRIWPEALVIHFTVRKPREWWRGGWCDKPVTKPPTIGATECAQIEVLTVSPASNTSSYERN